MSNFSIKFLNANGSGSGVNNKKKSNRHEYTVVEMLFTIAKRNLFFFLFNAPWHLVDCGKVLWALKDCLLCAGIH